jgi:hypothetical protein
MCIRLNSLYFVTLQQNIMNIMTCDIINKNIWHKHIYFLCGKSQWIHRCENNSSKLSRTCLRVLIKRFHSVYMVHYKEKYFNSKY